MLFDITCAQCGCLFQVPRSRVGQARWCTISCKRESTRCAPAPPVVDGSTWIPLAGGRFAIVDNDDVERISAYAWTLSDKGYAVTTTRDGRVTRHIKMHRLLMGVAADVDVDHINRNRLDNRRENLRAATKSNNMHNRVLPRASRSGYRGVVEHRRQWQAKIGIRGGYVLLGAFTSAEEAARAYDDAARRLHGAFARLNFPRVGERSADGRD